MPYKNTIHTVAPMKKYDVNLISYINKLRKMDFYQENTTLFSAQSRMYFINIYIIDNTNKYHNMIVYKDLMMFPLISLLITLLLMIRQLTIKQRLFPLYLQ